MSHSQFSLLKTPRFLPLFVTQFLGAFNDNVFKNALVILLTYRAGDSMGVDPRLMVTAAAGVFILPFFLFSATAGQLADKFDKDWIVRIIKRLEVPLMLIAAAGFVLNSYWMLMFVLFCVGTRSAFFGPLKYSILPAHLREDELIGGNALVEAGTFLAILLGTILGGVLVLRDGGTAMIAGVIVLVALGGWQASMRIPKAAAAAPDLKVDYNFIGAAFKLVNQARKETDVFLSIIGISWFWLVGFTFLAQFPVYASEVIGADEGVVTLFLTVFSIGIALGSLICNKLLKGEVSGLYVPLGAIGMTAGIFAFWLASPATALSAELLGVTGFLSFGAGWLVLASLMVIAIFGGIYIVPLYAIMQSRSAPEFRSRTVAVNNIVNSLFMVLGAVATMMMLKLNMAVVDIFLAIGVINIPVALLVRRIVRVRRAAKGV